MTEISSNDVPRLIDDGSRREPDPVGHSALLLVESLIHVLVKAGVILLDDAIEIVRTAAEVKSDIADDVGDTAASLAKSLLILETIRASLATDLPR